jgi:hypothetical protein
MKYKSNNNLILASCHRNDSNIAEMSQWLPALSKILLAFSIFLMLNQPLAAKYNLPALNNLQVVEDTLSTNLALELTSDNFITSFPSIYKFYLVEVPTGLEGTGDEVKTVADTKARNKNKQKRANKKKAQSKKKKARLAENKNPKTRIRLKDFSFLEDKLRIELPNNLAYGDYQLIIKQKVRRLKAKTQVMKHLVKIRPMADRQPLLYSKVINEATSIKANIRNIEHADYKLYVLNTKSQTYEEYKSENQLHIGENKLKISHSEDSYESVLSEAAQFYYIPLNSILNGINIISKEPLIASIDLKSGSEVVTLNISSILDFQTIDLNTTYYLNSLEQTHFLSKTVTLSPVYIKEIKVTGSEHAILHNRSAEAFPLDGCYLSDTTRKQYSFDDGEYIDSNQDYKIETKLSLNDTTPDELSLTCPDSFGDQIIDTFKYESHLDGLGVKI